MVKPLLPKVTLSLVAETNRQKIGLQQPPNRPYFQRMSFGSQIPSKIAFFMVTMIAAVAVAMMRRLLLVKPRGDGRDRLLLLHRHVTMLDRCYNSFFAALHV
jgi:hypothetical protein